MKNIYLYIGVLTALLMGCSQSNGSNNNCTSGDCNTSNTCPQPSTCPTPSNCPPADSCIEPENCPKADECPAPETGCLNGELSADKSDITLYYDAPKTVNITYTGSKNSGVTLKVEGNNCLDTVKTLKTDDKGKAVLSLKATRFGCTDGKKVKVCLAQNALNCDQNGNSCKDVCAELTVRTTQNTAALDKNGNLMIDEFETNKNKDKFSNYKPGDCSSYCHTDEDCSDSGNGQKGFCDSAIGYKCSTRCTSDDQCIHYLDENGNPSPMVCRADGRCAYREFKVVYNILKANATVTMGGAPFNGNNDVTIDWGDTTNASGVTVENFVKVEGNTKNNLSHTYQKAKKYVVTIRGDYRNWTAGCSIQDGIDVYDVQQFGEIGLGDDGDREHGSFTGCADMRKITAKDIPDSTKMTSMNSMFGGVDFSSGKGVPMEFNHPAITRWDTSNVTSMYRLFFNGGNGDISGDHGFNQDIGRWNTSKVTNLADMFLGAVEFNANISCWDTSKVKDISYLFYQATSFNQDLTNWDLSSVTKHDCVFRAENGHNGDISLNNYCKLREHLPVGDREMGREGNTIGTTCIEKKFYPNSERYTGSTCCGIQGTGPGTICEGGLDQGDACDNPDLKDRIIQNCLDNYIHKQDFTDVNGPKAYKDMEADDITCAHLRRCRDCLSLCDSCFIACKTNRKPGEDCAGVKGCPSGDEDGRGKVTLSADGRRLITWVENGNSETTCSCDHIAQ